MKSKMKTLLLMLIVVQLASQIVFPNYSQSDDAVIARVITSGDDTASDAGKLWFKLKDGTSVTKRIAIYNNSTKPSKINLSFVSAIRESNGNLKLNPEVPFKAVQYLKLSRNDFVLKSKGVQIVQIKATSPLEAPNESFEFYLKVTSQVVGGGKTRASKGVGIRIPVATAFALPAFIGIGKFEDQDFDFVVKSISGALDERGTKSFRVIIENSGNVPMKFSGNIQLSSLSLSSVKTEPLKFTTKVIPAGFAKFVDIALPPFIVEGRYKAYLEVSNGRLTQKMVKDVELEFPYPNSFLDNLMRILVGMLSAMMLLISLSYLRHGTNSLVIKKLTLILSFLRMPMQQLKLSKVPSKSVKFSYSEVKTEGLDGILRGGEIEATVPKSYKRKGAGKKSSSKKKSSSRKEVEKNKKRNLRKK